MSAAAAAGNAHAASSAAAVTPASAATRREPPHRARLAAHRAAGMEGQVLVRAVLNRVLPQRERHPPRRCPGWTFHRPARNLRPKPVAKSGNRVRNRCERGFNRAVGGRMTG
jgi:hypothetical protein